MKKIFNALMLVVVMAVLLVTTTACGGIYTDTEGELYLGDFDKTTPFFEEVYPEVKLKDDEMINPSYETFKVLNNPTNFQGLGEVVYENINGKTVVVDSFYRDRDEAAKDPNVGCGLMIWQCLQYKIQNPEEKVSICFTSYRVSVTTAVCVNPESRYYGYMRSLYGMNYDNHGFVRISYMLVEAARMGIEVIIVGQLNSYAVVQYSSTGSMYKRPELSYKQYFNEALLSDCYDKYAEGKKVSDFMTFAPVAWTLEDKGLDMMHVKTCTVSNYIDQNGKVCGPAVWYSSTNLDAISCKGTNGNNGAQSGVVISNHEEIYNITYNFVKLMAQYDGQEELYELRHYVNEENLRQAELIRAGRGEEIPKEQRIIYLGSNTDKVFEMYFTPFGGYADVWDIENNPYCKYIQKLGDSTSYVTFTFNNPNYTSGIFISKMIEATLEKAFIKKADPRNRLTIMVKGFDYSKFAKLNKDQIGFKKLANKDIHIHAKDMMMSYVEDGKRYYVSLLSACNFHLNALSYQTNQLLVIKETAETGNAFYKIFGDESTYGAIKKTETAVAFNGTDRLVVDENVNQIPTTFEATINLPKNLKTEGGVIFGSKDIFSTVINYEVNEAGNPVVYTSNTTYKKKTYTFNKVNLKTGKDIDLAITIDNAKSKINCYVNGKLKQSLSTVEKITYKSKLPYVIGGDNTGGNSRYFKGSIKKVALWKDVRTTKEIKKDSKSVDIHNKDLIAYYDLTISKNARTDVSYNGYDLSLQKSWLEEVEPVGEYAYSMALVGDTQALNLYHPEQYSAMYDWIVDNVDSQKIARVIGLGDITNDNSAEEWARAKAQTEKLDGVVPYTLVCGDHDKEVDYNNTFADSQYAAQITGSKAAGDYVNTYTAFRAGTTDYLIVTLETGATDNTIEWANGIIESYPDHKVIITTHAYLDPVGSPIDGTAAYPTSKREGRNDPDVIWRDLASKHENIVLVLSGHYPWDDISYIQTRGEKGNLVTQMLVNPQHMDYYLGGTGMVAMLYFSEDGNEIAVRYYSVTKECYGSQKSQFSLSLV